jgi:anamorsin
LSGIDYQALVPTLPNLLSRILSALSPLGTLHLHNLPQEVKSFSSDLTLTGFTILSDLSEGLIVAQSPAHSPGTSLSLRNRGETVPLSRPTNQERKKSNAAVWTLSSPSTPTIDAEALLTAADRERPAPICGPAKSGTVRRKCKGCTCELADLVEEETTQDKVIVLDGSEGGSALEVSERERLLIAAKNSSKATSSCGSCYLGDAFRCASCPYIGMLLQAISVVLV